MRPLGRLAPAVAAVTLLAVGCSDASGSSPEDGLTAVGSFYPLAFLAERIGGDEWDVADLTPPGAEAHDLELSIEDRAAIAEADLVLYLGDIGFQPQLEQAVKEAEGKVLEPGPAILFQEGDLPSGVDPHIWLRPALMSSLAMSTFRAMTNLGTGPNEGYIQRFDPLFSELNALDEQFETSLDSCRYRTIIVPHEAFGYWKGFKLQQLGLAGNVPEAEPSAARLSRALDLIRDGKAGAVFYESGGESQQVAETLASDAGVVALPLSTLESEPAEGDYLTVMRENLESLREGLDCP